MRRILVEYARRRGAKKRGGEGARYLLDTVVMTEPRAVDLIALDDALAKLTALDAEQGRVVELRFFGGLTEEETAEVLSVSSRTIHRKWLAARTVPLSRALRLLPMTPERWIRAQELYFAATEREPGSRAAFLEEACRGDSELRKEVESLLSTSSETPSGFLESPAIEALPALSPTEKSRIPIRQERDAPGPLRDPGSARLGRNGRSLPGHGTSGWGARWRSRCCRETWRRTRSV